MAQVGLTAEAAAQYGNLPRGIQPRIDNIIRRWRNGRLSAALNRWSANSPGITGFAPEDIASFSEWQAIK